jgi:hypothetical protein
MFKQLRALAAKHFGYKVTVIGGTFGGAKHYALTQAEALAWARCYKPQHRRAVVVRNWIGLPVAQIGQLGSHATRFVWAK